tara:strand:- start:978 stop:1256 length:279 start_codon:yes stop_codon:yes gene_type:complete
MKQVQLFSLTPEENNQPIFDYIDKKFDELKKSLQPKEGIVFLTRKDVSERLQYTLSTVHNLTKQGILTKYQQGGNVRYKQSEVEEAFIKINN